MCENSAHVAKCLQFCQKQKNACIKNTIPVGCGLLVMFQSITIIICSIQVPFYLHSTASHCKKITFFMPPQQTWARKLRAKIFSASRYPKKLNRFGRTDSGVTHYINAHWLLTAWRSYSLNQPAANER